MALIISFVNKSGLADVSDYEVHAWINEHHIAGPFKVKGHNRNDGWFELLQRFIDTGREERWDVESRPARKIQSPKNKS